MAQHRFDPMSYHNVLGTLAPVLSVEDGDSVVTTTLDAHGFDASGTACAASPNPMTGPFYVAGAEPGDALVVSIDRMTPTRDTGWTFSSLARNVVDPDTVPTLTESRKTIWRLDRQAMTARLDDPVQGLEDFSLPLAPMIGCFGVAPALGQAISTATSARERRQHGLSPLRPGHRRGLSRLRARRAVLPRRRPRLPGRRRDRRHRHRDLLRGRQFAFRCERAPAIGWPRGETTDDIFTSAMPARSTRRCSTRRPR